MANIDFGTSPVYTPASEAQKTALREGIGAAALSASNVFSGGSNTFVGNLTVQGNSILGDSTSDVVRLAGTSAASAASPSKTGRWSAE